MRTFSRIGLIAAEGMLVATLLMPSFALAAGSAPATPSTGVQTPSANNTNDTSFVPLTKFPQIQALAQPNGFTGFVNTLYKILIGAGAVIAVIMIMVAGVEFMTNKGSVASNEKAKNHIRNAIFGLILILAPTIVFGIINPSILNLNLGTEFGGLKLGDIKQDAFSSPLQAQQCTSAQQRSSCSSGFGPILCLHVQH
jgi:hypothetical protein